MGGPPSLADDGEVFEDALEVPLTEDESLSCAGRGVEGPSTPTADERGGFSDCAHIAFENGTSSGDSDSGAGLRERLLRGRKSHAKQASTEAMDPKLAAAYRAPSLQTELTDTKPSYTGGRVAGDTDYSLHRAVFDGNIDEAQKLLAGMHLDEKEALDPQGNSALHIAVLRQRPSAAIALLEAGVPVGVLNSRRWTALDEAVSLRHKELVKLLHARETALLKAEMKAKKADVLRSIVDIPDVSFQLKWELGSPVLGMLLRKYAPHDTYQVWKRGTQLRVDGSLMGLDDKRTSLLPQWKRGHFSLLFDGATTPATMLLCDHAKRKYIDLSKEKKAHKPTLDDEAAMIISEGAGKTKMRASEFRFKVVKTWLGNDSTEKIEGWRTRIFEAAGKMTAVTINKSPLVIPDGASYEDYLRLQPAEDEVTEVPIDPYSMDASSSGSKKAAEKGLRHFELYADGGLQQGSEDAEAKKRRPKPARRLTGKCWMAEDFPMSLKQLLPLLEVIGNANKHIARVGKFLQKYGDLSLFPVKLQVPLVYTVYALISFRQFKPLAESAEEAARTDAWYRLPDGYTLKTFDDIAASRRTRRSASWDEAEDAPTTRKSGDAAILAQMGL